MERYLLDTNILAFIICSEQDNLSPFVEDIIDEQNNLLHVSSVSVIELLQLFKIQKIKPKGFKNATEIVAAIENLLFIKILPFTKTHTEALAKLKIANAHNDPFDHAIISHAIADKLTLVSSDRKFKEYVTQNLKFVYNKR